VRPSGCRAAPAPGPARAPAKWSPVAHPTAPVPPLRQPLLSRGRTRGGPLLASARRGGACAAPPPSGCRSLQELSALAAAEARRQGPTWHAAALSQLSRLAAKGGNGGAGGGGGGGASTRAAEQLARQLATSLQKALARPGSWGSGACFCQLQELAAAAAALARVQALAPATRPALQMALRRLEAAAVAHAAPSGEVTALSRAKAGNSNAQEEGGAAKRKEKCGAGEPAGTAAIASDEPCHPWQPACLTAAARGLAAARDAGEAPGAAALDAVVRACRAAVAAPSPPKGSPEVSIPAADCGASHAFFVVAPAQGHYRPKQPVSSPRRLLTCCWLSFSSSFNLPLLRSIWQQPLRPYPC
jgi:hypothetical protein